MWLTLPFYDFCGFRSVAVNSVYKLQFFYIYYCMEMFNVQNPHYAITKRKCKFLSNIMSAKNVLCELCREFAEKELELCAHASN